VCGAAKRVCAASEVGLTLPALQAAVTGAYPAFSCERPTDEPTCVPARPVSVGGSSIYAGTTGTDDLDGDGIPNAADGCPRVFDPVRASGGGAQADQDGDGAGDACDPCPLDAGSTTCTRVDPLDLDGDGRPQVEDNCPNVANADQADQDLDGKGDACDACPDVSNPGAQPCPTTIYAVRDGSVAPGEPVALPGVLVTAVAPGGFFVQVAPGDPEYAGSDRSGLFVYWTGGGVLAGDRVSAAGTVTSFFGETQLAASAVQVNASAGEVSPPAVLADPGDVATGGARAAALEGVLVRVENVTVLDVAPAPGPGDVVPTNEVGVTGGLRVDDLLYLVSPFPALGDVYASVTGVLVFRHGSSKLAPRSAADVVAAPP
jgi:large repetitive protein